MFSVRQIYDLIRYHGQVKLRLADAIATKDASQFCVPLCSATDCRLTVWFEDEQLPDEIAKSKSFSSVEKLHLAFHSAAEAVLKAVEEDRIGAAQALFDEEFSTRSRELVLSLMRWRDELSRIEYTEPPRLLVNETNPIFFSKPARPAEREVA